MTFQFLVMLQGFNRTEAGYTLLELLVVLAIVSLIILSAPTAYTVIVPNLQVRQYANDLANLSRELRQEAIQHNRVVGLVFDPNSEAITSYGWSTLAGRTQLEVPLGVSINFTREMGWKMPGDNKVEFYPSGGSSGGKFMVSRGNIQIEVNINWISGAVRVRQ